MRRLAAIDAGSTSVHLLVADVSDAGIGIVRDASTFAGLGEAVSAGGRLGDATISALGRILDDGAAQAAGLGAEGVLLVGTAPLRRAADAARAVRHVEREHRLDLHVLTEHEEALLTLVGATGGRRPTRERAVVDVGGGSTEVVLAAPDRPPEVTPVELGAASLAGRHTTGDPPAAEELAAIRADARAAVAVLPRGGPRSVVAVGGTADNLAKLAGAPHLTVPRLEDVLTLLGTLTADETSARFGVRPARARLVPAGAAIVLAVLERWGIDAVEVSASGLREGAVLALAHAGTAWRDRLPELARGWRDGAPPGGPG